MIFESAKTAKGNIGVSYVSAEKAVAQAEEMDSNGCVNCYNCYNCYNCSRCSDCYNCYNCLGGLRCSSCSDCSDCSDCYNCSDCLGFVSGEPTSTPEQSIENLDKVRAIILDSAERLDMAHWHGNSDWKEKTCAEEAVCGTTHCLAGWLQVCATDPEIRAVETHPAGAMQAPIAAKMFFRGSDEVLAWLMNRTYVTELGVVENAG
jgi:hypothetical protein